MALTPTRAAAPLAALALALAACTAAPPLETPTSVVAPTPSQAAASPTPTTPSPGNPDVEACRLPDGAGGSAVGLGQPRSPDRLPSTGDVNIAVLFVDFSDAPAAASVADRFAALDGTEQWYADVSYGRLAMHLRPDTQWLRMSKKSTAYSYATYDSHRDFVAEAIALADPAYDFSDVDGVLVMVSDTQTALTSGPTLTSSYGDGIVADGTEIVNAVTSASDLDYWGYLWAVHELGHSLGLPDLYDYTGDNIHRHVGGFSLMGDIAGFAPEEFAFSRWQLGWIDDAAVACQTGAGGDYSLTPVEAAPSGTMLVVVPTGATSAVVVEYRTPQGYDAALSERGVLVYAVDTAIPSGSGQVEVYPRKPANRDGALLGEGESLTVDGVVVTVTGLTDAAAHVQVGYAGE